MKSFHLRYAKFDLLKMLLFQNSVLTFSMFKNVLKKIPFPPIYSKSFTNLLHLSPFYCGFTTFSEFAKFRLIPLNPRSPECLTLNGCQFPLLILDFRNLTVSRRSVPIFDPPPNPEF